MSSSCHTTFAVVTGGGTSGHVLAAMAIADALVARGHDRAAIHYVGTSRGVEQRLLPPTGYDYTLLDVVGLQRRMSVRNLAFAPKLLRSTYRAIKLIRRLSPKVVVNVGGYASVPATVAAMLCRIPVVVVSYDRRPGLVSKLAARRAAACAVAFAGSTLPRATLTGAPIRVGPSHSLPPIGDAIVNKPCRSSTCPAIGSCSPCSAVRWAPRGSTT